MKILRMAVIAAATSMMMTTAIAQKVKLKSGSLDMLKGTTDLNVQYDYSNMTVTTKNKPEAEFLATKKEAGKGDTWASGWEVDRDKRYAVQFKEEFEKQSGIKIGVIPEAKYTLIFHTTHTETGYNIGISRRNAYIDGEAMIVETANPGNVLATITIDAAAGRTFGGYDYDTGVRLQESYALAGKAIGKFIKKKL